MNQNLRTFLAIFAFITGVVGAVLAVANMTTEPVATTYAVVFAAVAVMGFVAGFLLTRRPRY